MASLPDDGLIFISLPETIKREIGAFVIDPAVLLPVEVPRDNPEWNLKNLSWEMILAGILRLLSDEPRHPRADYYRRFAFAVKPDIKTTLETSAVLKAKNKEFDLAEEFFRLVLGLDPEDGTAALNLALLYEQREETYAALSKPDLAAEYREKAEALYRRLCVGESPAADVHLRFGSFLVRHDDAEGGLASLLRYRESGISEKNKIEVDEVIRGLEGRLTQDKLFRSAYELIRSGSEAEGISRVTEFLAFRPRDWNAWFLLGWGRRRTGDYAGAKRAFLEARSLKPDEPDTLNELAICCMELGEYEESGEALRRAAELDPENIKILSNLAILYVKSGREAEARLLFRSLAEKAPDDPIVRRYLEFLL